MKKKKREKKNAVWFAALLIIFGAVFFLSFMWGKYSISPGEIFRMIAERITGAESGIPAAKEKVFFNIRPVSYTHLGAYEGAGSYGS